MASLMQLANPGAIPQPVVSASPPEPMVSSGPPTSQKAGIRGQDTLTYRSGDAEAQTSTLVPGRKAVRLLQVDH